MHAESYILGRFIPDEFLILMTAFMDRGSVTYKNPAYFFFRRKKSIQGSRSGKKREKR